MSVILSSAPFRISLGGGGTDLPSFYQREGGFLVAGAIDKYAYLILHPLFQQTYRLKYSRFEEVAEPSQIEHPILRECLKNYWNGEPLEIASVADVPAGTGLGSSAAFCVSLLQALAHLSNEPLSRFELAERACHIEIDLLREPVGKQDQYVSAFGGINTYEFNVDGRVNVAPVNISGETIERLDRNLLLFYTGQTRSAGSILKEQQSKTAGDDETVLRNLRNTKTMGHLSVQLLENGNLERYGQLMHEHWMNKRSRTRYATNTVIDEMYEYGLQSGAIGGKLVGAGGGGFLMFYTEQPEKLKAAFSERNITELKFCFDFDGPTILR